MKMHMVNFICAECGNQFKAADLINASYGEFLLRSIGSADEVALDATGDRTYEEVNALVKANPRVNGKKPNAIASVLREIYGKVACDTDSFGKPFQIGAFPRCKHCGSQNMDYWEVSEPVEIVEKSVRPATHVAWVALAVAEKKQRVDEALEELGF